MKIYFIVKCGKSRAYFCVCVCVNVWLMKNYVVLVCVGIFLERYFSFEVSNDEKFLFKESFELCKAKQVACRYQQWLELKGILLRCDSLENY